MVSTNFMKYFAEKSGYSQAASKDFLKSLDEAVKSYVGELAAGDSFKFADVTLKVVEVPERSGVSAFNGQSWTKPAHNALKVSLSPSLKASVK